MSEKLVSRLWDVPDANKLAVSRQHGAYSRLEKALSMKPEAIVEEVKKSNLRGQGGAGFPAGMKWSFVPKQSDKPRFLCVNADEGEPGTYKDRQIIEKDPHLLLEGAAICCYAVGLPTAYIYIRGEFFKGKKILDSAIAEAYQAGFLGQNILGSGFSLDIYTHPGAGAYICGEETALLNSLEGKKGWPRIKPPFPAVVGLFGGPTVINNVETLSYVPFIIEKGAQWFASLGVERNGGNKLFGVSGHVNKPGVYELPMGTKLKDIIYNYAGGIKGGKALKAVIPGGSSTPVLLPDEIDVAMDFESVAKAGSMLGSGAVIVMDETTDISYILYVTARFYAHESCGQCTPCREGTRWMRLICQRIYEGKGRKTDLDLLIDIANNIEGKTVCPLGAAAAMPVRGMVKKFRKELEGKIISRG
jgi:NADH-quinone oxidoreductase subunit F